MKLLAADYDGTLAFNETIMPEDIQAIQEWRAKGNLFVVVTGRAKSAIDEQLKKNGIEYDYVVSNCGSLVYNPQHKLLQTLHLDYITGIDTIFIAKETQGVVSVMANDEQGSHRIIVNTDLRDQKLAHIMPDLKEEEILDLPAYTQVVVSMATEEVAKDFAAQLNEHFSGTLTAYPNNYCVDIVSKGISKATGVEFIKEYENVDIDDVYVIGDSYNDIPLLKYGNHPGAMFTAPSQVLDLVQDTYFSVKQFMDEIE